MLKFFLFAVIVLGLFVPHGIYESFKAPNKPVEPKPIIGKEVLVRQEITEDTSKRLVGKKIVDVTVDNFAGNHSITITTEDKKSFTLYGWTVDEKREVKRVYVGIR